jgi:hypothetical protein
LFQTSSTQSDLFLETPRFTHVPFFDFYRQDQPNLYGDGIPTPQEFEAIANQYSELTRIWVSYWDCLGPIKIGCEKYGKVRFHNLEYRRPYIPHPFLNYELLIVSDDVFFATQNGYQIANKLNLCPDLLAAMIDGNLKEVSRLFLQLYQDFPNYLPAYEYETLVTYSGYDRLSRQFQNLPKRDELKMTLINRMTALVTPPIIPDGPDDYEKIQLINDRVSQISDLFNDTYTIGRMIKSIYLYPDSQLIWIYAGYAHIYTIESLLRNIYNPTVILDIMPKMTSPSCIDLSIEDQLRIHQELKAIISS